MSKKDDKSATTPNVVIDRLRHRISHGRTGLDFIEQHCEVTAGEVPAGSPVPPMFVRPPSSLIPQSRDEITITTRPADQTPSKKEDK